MEEAGVESETRAPGRTAPRAGILVTLNLVGVALLPVWFTFLGLSVMGFDSGTDNLPLWVWAVFWGNAGYPALLGVAVEGTWIAWAAGSPKWARRFALLPGAWVVFVVGFFVFAVVASA